MSVYTETETGNRICRDNDIRGAQYIMISGKCIIDQGVCLRGDLHKNTQTPEPIIALNRYNILRPYSTLSPPIKGSKSSSSFSPHLLKTGPYVYIGSHSHIEAASIGSCVYIGKNVTIGKFTIIKDCVVIEDNSVVPPYSVIPPFSKVKGTPGLVVSELPDSAPEVLELFVRKYYVGIDVDVPFSDLSSSSSDQSSASSTSQHTPLYVSTPPLTSD